MIAESADYGDQSHQRGFEPGWVLEAVGLTVGKSEWIVEEIGEQLEVIRSVLADVGAR